MKKFFENRPRFWFVIGLIFVVLITAVTVFIQQDKGVIKVGAEKITEKEINDALYAFDFQGTREEPKQRDNEELRKSVVNKLIEESIVRQEAKKRNLTVTREEIEARAKLQLSDIEKRNQDQQELAEKTAENYLLEEKVKEVISGYSEGDFVLVRFDKYVGTDDAKYAEEKLEAKTLSDDIYSKLNAKTMNFEEAKKTVEAHPLFGEDAFKKLGFKTLISGKFNKTVYENGLGIIADQDFKKLVRDTNAGEISEPSILKVAKGQGDEDAKGEMVDGIYAIVKVDKVQGGEAESYEVWLKGKKSEYVKKNILEKLLDSLQIQYASAAWAGSCSGGLVTSGTNQAAGFFFHYYITTAAGGFYELPNAEVVVQSSDGDSYSWNGTWHACSTGDVMCSGCTPDTAVDGAWFPGWTNMGYPSCGGNGYGLLCSCKDSYIADFIFKPVWGINEAYVEHVGYYHPNGVNVTDVWYNTGVSGHTFVGQYPSGGLNIAVYYNPNIDPFAFNDIVNGGTAGMNVYFKQVPPAPVTYALTAVKGGTGTGTIISEPTGINCGTDCNESYNAGTTVTLTATPATGSTFTGWSGACAGIVNPCTVVMDAAKTVTATFNATPVANLSCSVAPPTGGKIPLSIVVTVHNAIAGNTYNYDFNYNENEGVNEYTGRESVVTYSYSRAGSYIIKVTENGSGRSAFCPETPYPVTAPDDGTGGEVAP